MSAEIPELIFGSLLSRYYLIRQLPGNIPATDTFPGRGRQNGGFAANHTIDELLAKLKFVVMYAAVPHKTTGSRRRRRRKMQKKRRTLLGAHALGERRR